MTEAEIERLALLAEEMGEAIQIIGKVLRRGWNSYHPADPEGPNNREMLERELGHVLYAMDLMEICRDITYSTVVPHKIKKRLSVGKYLRHNIPEGKK